MLDQKLAKNDKQEDDQKICPIILRFQMFMLTNTDRLGRNVFHIACENGLNSGLKFLIQKAWDFGALEHVLN